LSNNIFKNWWRSLIFEPGDPKLLTGGQIKIAAIGGGSGLATILRGLKKYSDHISAIVAVTDDGASSGKLRDEFDILPPGDIRKCVSALTYNESLLSEILEYRFQGRKKSLSGHTLGNIWITALTKHYKSFAKSVEITSQIFRAAGRIYPATLDNIKIGAEYFKGRKSIGESKIAQPGRRIKKVFLNKKNIRAYPKAVAAIKEADLIIIGPGSLYTSVIPNLLIPGIKLAIKNNHQALRIYIANCSTERGETEGYEIFDHIKAIIDHSGKIFDYCLVNKHLVKKTKEYSKLGTINNITTRNEEIIGVKILLFDIINHKLPLYHDSDKLASSLIKIYQRKRKQ
jgi:uncharacterized cofD-like protein